LKKEKTMTLTPSLPLRNTQQNNIAPIATPTPVKSPIKKLPKVLLQKIQNYLQFTKGAPIVHLVCRSWYNLMPNDGHLDLSDSSITGLDLAKLIKNYNKSGKLVSLNLFKCYYINDGDLEHLAELHLTQLTLTYCKKLVRGLEHLTRLPLTQLNLCYCCAEIPDAGFEHLGKITSLTKLTLTSFKLTDAGLMHLIKLPLTQLYLDECTDITDTVLKYLAKTTSLTQLDLSYCRKITDKGIEHLTTLPLTHLNLSYCVGITDACLEHLAKLPLTKIIMTGCTIAKQNFERLCTLKQLDESVFEGVDL
jgi:hypothetical protein